VVVRLPAPPSDRPAKRRLVHVGSPWAGDVRQRQLADGSIEVRIATRGDVVPKAFTLGNPARIVIDIESAERAAEDMAAPQRIEGPGAELLGPLPPAGGVMLEERQFGTARGPVRVNVLYVDLRRPDVRVGTALAAPTIGHRARPTVIARREGAYAAANGGFFAPRGEPLGMLVIDGEWVSHPIFGRAALGVMEDGRVVIDNVEFDGSVELPDVGTLRLTGINARHREAPELIAYNRRWGGSVSAAPQTTHVSITDRGVISRVETGAGESFVPAGGWVVSGTGANAAELAKAQLGTRVDLSVATNPRWDGLLHALGGGPRLVKDGQPHVTAQQEHFRSDVRLGTAARTAVGVDADGRLLLVTVGGRAANSRRGMTLADLASVLAKLGAKDAMNLDGGSSSTLAVGSRVVNKPSSGWERAVSNALLVFATAEAAGTAVASGR